MNIKQRVNQKIDKYMENMKVQSPIYDVKPTKRAINDANKIMKRLENNEELEDVITEFANEEKFSTHKGMEKHKKGILHHLVQNKTISEEKAEKTWRL